MRNYKVIVDSWPTVGPFECRNKKKIGFIPLKTWPLLYSTEYDRENAVVLSVKPSPQSQTASALAQLSASKQKTQTVVSYLFISVSVSF